MLSVDINPMYMQEEHATSGIGFAFRRAGRQWRRSLHLHLVPFDSFSDLELPKLLGGFVGALHILLHSEVHSFDVVFILFFFVLAFFLATFLSFGKRLTRVSRR